MLLEIDPYVKAIAMSGYALAPVMREPERQGFKGLIKRSPLTSNNCRRIFLVIRRFVRADWEGLICSGLNK